MPRVLIATQSWGWLADREGTAQPNKTVAINNLDGSPASVFSALSGGSALTALETDQLGTIPGYIEAGTYTLTVDDVPRRIEAVSGTASSGGGGITSETDPIATAALATHEADTTNIHGIANTANLVLTDDSRLSDARTPTAHTHPQSDVTGLTSALSAKVATTDPRLSDARTPTAHTHPQSDVTGLAASLDQTRPHTTEPTDVGLATWTYDPAAATSASAPVAGTAYFIRIPIRETITVSNVVFVISTPGTGATPLANCYAALFDAAGNRRGVSADQSIPWASGTAKAMALTVDAGQSLTVNKSDGYAYAAFVVGTQSTTNLQIFRSGSSAGPGQLLLTASTTPPARFLAKTGFATGLPTTIAYNTCSVSSFLFWMGFS